MKRNRLLINSKKKFFLELSGNHLSKYSGGGLDFKDLKEYTNEDIRFINWKVSAKEQKPFINEFYEHKKINLVVVLLNSGGLYFGSFRQKIDIAKEIFFLLVGSGVYNNDIVKGAIISKSKDYEFNSINKKSLIKIQNLSIDPLNKKIDYKVLNEYLLAIKQKSVVFLIGDFFEDIDLKLVSKKHEINLIIVRDKLEEDLKLFGEFNLIDTNSLMEFDTFLDDEALFEYQEALKYQDSLLFNYLKKNKIRFKKIYTNDNIVIKLKEFLNG